MDATEPQGDGLAQRLRACLIDRGVIAPEAAWHRLGGGRTNAVWRLDGGPRTLVCKLSLAGRATPLFPNDAVAEGAALEAMSPLGLAPHPLGRIATDLGPCLIYRHVDARNDAADPALVGAMLARLHAEVPMPGLRRVAADPGSVLGEGDAMLRLLPPALANLLVRCRPRLAPLPGAADIPDAFLHGDPAPGNILATAEGVMLIDWQCPARGDPLHDLAIYLSPAMQILTHGRPLTEAGRARCLEAYGPGAAVRFALGEPAFLWRMAVHCAWRLARGEADCRAALIGELERLEQVGQPDSR